MAAPSKTEQDILEIAFAGGNIPGGYVINPTSDPILDPVVRKMTADESRAASDAVADEAGAAKRRTDLLKRTDTPTPATDPGAVPDAAR